MKTILIVEDNPSINQLYKKLFNEDSGWKASFTDSFAVAIEILKENSQEYIISDGIVKDDCMNGIEFLNHVKELSPESIRLFVSGTIIPNDADFKCFDAFINKKDLNGKELVEVLNYLALDDLSVPNKFFETVFIG